MFLDRNKNRQAGFKIPAGGEGGLSPPATKTREPDDGARAHRCKAPAIAIPSVNIDCRDEIKPARFLA
jgi:hypothetical protein